jgi:hypothetical protein
LTALKQKDDGMNLPAIIKSGALQGKPEEAKALAPGKVQSRPLEIYEGEVINDDPPIDVIITANQIKERIIDYLGAVLARCWVDRTLLDKIEANPHQALRHIGILLPPEIDIKVERSNQQRPRLVIYEYNADRSMRMRICYLQLMMMAGK